MTAEDTATSQPTRASLETLLSQLPDTAVRAEFIRDVLNSDVISERRKKLLPPPRVEEALQHYIAIGEIDSASEILKRFERTEELVTLLKNAGEDYILEALCTPYEMNPNEETLAPILQEIKRLSTLHDYESAINIVDTLTSMVWERADGIELSEKDAVEEARFKTIKLTILKAEAEREQDAEKYLDLAVSWKLSELPDRETRAQELREEAYRLAKAQQPQNQQLIALTATHTGRLDEAEQTYNSLIQSTLECWRVSSSLDTSFRESIGGKLVTFLSEAQRSLRDSPERNSRLLELSVAVSTEIGHYENAARSLVNLGRGVEGVHLLEKKSVGNARVFAMQNNLHREVVRLYEKEENPSYALQYGRNNEGALTFEDERRLARAIWREQLLTGHYDDAARFAKEEGFEQEARIAHDMGQLLLEEE